jgi:hypothetical protein
MDWLEFIASVISNVTWPIVVLVLAFRFSDTIAGAFKQLHHIKAPGVEATFGDALAGVEESAQAVLDAAGIPVDETDPKAESRIDRTTDPSGMIIRAWQDLSLGLTNLTNASGGETIKNSSRSTTALIRRLRDEGTIDPKFAATLLELRALRNAVAHGRHDPTEGEALTYAETARELGAYLDFMSNHYRAHGPGPLKDSAGSALGDQLGRPTL